MKTLDILTAVRAAGFTEAKYISADVDFAKPMLNWLTGTFYDFYKSWRSDYGFDTWDNKLDCIAGFEKVITPTGSKLVNTLVDGDVVLTYNFNTKQQEFLPIVNVTPKGELQSCNLKYKNHTSMTVSKTHPIFHNSVSPWNRKILGTPYSVSTCESLLSNKNKSYSPCVKTLHAEIVDTEHSVDDYFILGHFIAEGWIQRNQVFTSGYEIDSDIIPVLKRNGIRYSYRKNNSGVPYVYFARPQPICGWLASFKTNSFEMTTNSLVNLPVEKIEAFLRGHWIGDGHIQDGYTVHSTSSDDLAQTIFTMYLRLGRPAQKYYQKNHMGCGTKPIWRVMVHGKSNFSKDFGFSSLSETAIKSINPVGEVDCYDFSTPNGNYILENGLVVHNCDNFASMFYCFAQLCHSKSDRSEQGIAVGEMFYLVEGDKNRGHAINIAITDVGVVTIEPQTGKVLKLTDAEKKSCWFIRF